MTKARLAKNTETWQLVKVADHYQQDIKNYHKVTWTQPYGSEDERQSIGQSLKIDGQLEPIWLWKKRGKTSVVDGRNRLDGCIKAGIEDIYAVEIPSNTKIEDLEVMIGQTRTRVHSTKTILAITAFREHKAKGINQMMAAQKHSVSKKLLVHCSYINKTRPTVLDLLFKGGMYETMSGRLTDVLSVIRKDIEYLEKLAKESNDDQQEEEPGDPMLAQAYEITRLAVTNMKLLKISKSHISTVLKDLLYEVNDDEEPEC
jgi:hypothetical protein